MTLSALRQDGKGAGKRALAAALAGLERDPDGDAAQALLDAAWRAPKAHVVGVTGPPGVGKSSLCAALVAAWRKAGQTVGVIAVDPSSKSSGGALLGDRVRIVADSADEGSFVRSMAARDRLGGLADQTLAAMVVMRALFDRVLIETVGVGQSETDVAGVADTVVFCVQPGSGDSLQFMKAGIVEIPHLIVVTKADLGAAAERARADVAGALSLASAGDGDWPLRTLAVSSRSGAGIDGLMAALEAHRAHLAAEGRLVLARHRQSEGWIVESLRERFGREGIARLGRLGFDLALAPGAQPFQRLRELGAALQDDRGSTIKETRDEPSDRQQLHLLQDRRRADPVLQAARGRCDDRLHGHQSGEPGPCAGRRQGPLADRRRHSARRAGRGGADAPSGSPGGDEGLSPFGVNLLQANGAGAGAERAAPAHPHHAAQRNDGLLVNWAGRSRRPGGDRGRLQEDQGGDVAGRQGGGHSQRRLGRRHRVAALGDREPFALVLAELFAHVVDHRADAGALVGLLVAHQPDVAHDLEVDRARRRGSTTW